MEMFGEIWRAVSTPNEGLINFLLVPISLIEAYVTMLLFSSILNIDSTKNQKIIYVIIMAIISFVTRNFIPVPYNTFVNMIAYILVVFIVLKTSILKAIIAEILPLAVGAIIESLFFKIFLIIFNAPFDSVMTIPIYRIPFICLIYFINYILYRLTKHFNFNIKLLEDMNPKKKLILFLNFSLGVLSIAVQSYLTTYYSDNLPVLVTVLSIVSLTAYFLISIYSLMNTTKLELTTRDLKQTKLDNKTLKILYDNMSTFKHDFDNIVQAIQGYIVTDDMDGLKAYYNGLQLDCDKVNNLLTLRPDVINNPAVYSLLASKYHKANNEGIEINLDVFLDLNKLHMKIYDFTKILGILLDNAIEASKECDEKVVNVIMRKDRKRFRQLLIIENTYNMSDLDMDRIFEKGYSTKSKKTNSGIGLWEVRQILKRNKNLNLYTDTTDKYFRQQLEIYVK